MSTKAETSSSASEPAEPAAALPLADLHRSLGARLASYRGVEVPAGYGAGSGLAGSDGAGSDGAESDGAESDEYAALRQGCGLIDTSWRERIEMRGEDRLRFLNGLVTCDVKSLEPGGGTYGFITSVKGRVLADVAVSALEDRLWIELSSGTSVAVTEHLSKYVIVDRVEISRLEDAVPLTLIGPACATAVAGAMLPEAEYGHLRTSVHGCTVDAVRGPSLGASPVGEIETWTLWVAAASARQLFEALCDHGAKPVGHEAFDRLRVEAGRPLFGRDFDSANFPQETGLGEEAVSYTKGCYLGQEVVARIHYRGGVNRHLRRLAFSGPPAPDSSASALVGRVLKVEGREVGRVTSAVTSDEGQRIGLAILHQRAAPDSEIEVEGGGTARIS